MIYLDRYDLKLCDGESGSCHAELQVSRNGDWVHASDYDELQEKFDELAKKIDEARCALS